MSGQVVSTAGTRSNSHVRGADAATATLPEIIWMKCFVGYIPALISIMRLEALPGLRVRVMSVPSDCIGV
jgi:hypothetical protein